MAKMTKTKAMKDEGTRREGQALKLLTTCYVSDDWVNAPSFALIHLDNPQELLDRMECVADANAADDTLWHITYNATQMCYAKYVNWCEEIEAILDQDNNHDHVMDGFALALPDDFQVPDDQVASVGMETVVVFPEEAWLEAHLTKTSTKLESRRITADGITKALASNEAKVVL